MNDCARADAATLLHETPSSSIVRLSVVGAVALLALFLTRFLAKPALRCLVMILQRDHQAFHRPQRAERDQHDQRSHNAACTQYGGRNKISVTSAAPTTIAPARNMMKTAGPSPASAKP